MPNQIKRLAQANLDALRSNPYPGRGIVVGLDQSGKYLVQVYWIMGRSENSRNRIFEADNETGRLYTEAADATKMKDPSLVIYNAMRERGPHFIVSNGDQTDTVAESPAPLLLNVALRGRKYEPDAPNFTQRISATSSLSKGRPYIQMVILRKSLFGEQCDRFLYEYTPHPGFGHCITTYAGDGDPLPAFCGDPLLMPLAAGLKEVAEAYWQALDEANRVSLAVKFIEIGNGRSDIHIINKYNQVP
jgi:hypothetical protein